MTSSDTRIARFDWANLAARLDEARHQPCAPGQRIGMVLTFHDARQCRGTTRTMPTLDRTFTLLGRDGKPFPSLVPGAFGGHRGSKLYGRLDCRAALKAIARGGYVKHRVFFLDEATAIAAGYRPCAVCLPSEYAMWKRAAHQIS